ncbi:MAG: hypothetical protein LBC45_04375 [Chlamydiales bacterium]|jgi:hypothetical protein|nr:hypothetical protein [Chlamydiales bacterium]
MTTVFFPNSQTLFEKSSLAPSSKIEAHVSTPQIHFEKSSLAPSVQIEIERSSKPQLPSSFSPHKSYQVLLIKHVKSLDALQGRLLKFDMERVEQVSEKIKMIFSKLLEKTGYSREKAMEAHKWKRIATFTGDCILITYFWTPSMFASLPIVLKVLQGIFIGQHFANQARFLHAQEEIVRLDHELKKGKNEHLRLIQDSKDNIFTEIEEQVHLLAIALEKQTINF